MPVPWILWECNYSMLHPPIGMHTCTCFTQVSPIQSTYQIQTAQLLTNLVDLLTVLYGL